MLTRTKWRWTRTYGKDDLGRFNDFFQEAAMLPMTPCRCLDYASFPQSENTATLRCSKRKLTSIFTISFRVLSKAARLKVYVRQFRDNLLRLLWSFPSMRTGVPEHRSILSFKRSQVPLPRTCRHYGGRSCTSKYPSHKTVELHVS